MPLAVAVFSLLIAVSVSGVTVGKGFILLATKIIYKFHATLNIPYHFYPRQNLNLKKLID